MNGEVQASTAKAMRSPACQPQRQVCWLMLVIGLLATLLENVDGQEAVRQSIAGAAAAEAQHQAATTIGYYNLRMGDVTLRFSSGMGAQYNDNINLSATHREGDFIFTPQLNLQLHSPVTENNCLDLAMGAGYNMYVIHTDQSQFFITPGSGLLYSIFIGDFVITLYDRISITENGYQNPTANGNGYNSSLQNNVGAGVSWDLNQVIVKVGYDHGNYVSLGSGLTQPNSASDSVNLNAGVQVLPELTVGPEAGVSAVTYSQSPGTPTPDTKQWSAGGFGQWQISDYMSAQLHAGYTELLPQNAGTNLNTGPSGEFYFDGSLSHRVNEWLNYTLSAYRSQDLQLYGQPYTTAGVRWSGTWNLLKNYSLGTSLWWSHGTQFYYQANIYDQYGGGLNVGRQITEKLSGTVSYQYIQETSAQADLNYIVNIISLNLSYRF
jgi:hypothetical protein